MDFLSASRAAAVIKALDARHSRFALIVILIFGMLLRLDGWGFGLPALLDPDEPIFVIVALKLLAKQTLNPGWFGHPGSTTIYSIALIQIAVFVTGWITGYFKDAASFAAAVYHDPSLIIYPIRFFMIVCGLTCVGLTYLIGQRLLNTRVGLLAALLLAANPLHIKWSQIIRTDVHASVFMLLCVLASFAIVKRGRMIDYVLAGAMVGLSVATKWPSAVIVLAPVGGWVIRMTSGSADPLRERFSLIATAVAVPVALFLASPFLFIDASTVVQHVSGESQLHHLGATGGSFFWNLGWYFSVPLADSIGILGCLLLAMGCLVVVLKQKTVFALVVIPALAFLALVSSQHIVWARWIVPILPLLMIVVAAQIVVIGDWIAKKTELLTPVAAQLMIALALLVPMLATDIARGNERRHETRSLAARWAMAHIPPNSKVLIEHLGFDMVDEPWTFLIPAGNVGCVDALSNLKGKIGFDSLNSWRSVKAIVDIGTINGAKLDTCRADYAIITNYDRYVAEGRFYQDELNQYHRYLKGGHVVATFAPRPGYSTGYKVRIVKFPRRQDQSGM